MIEPFQRVMAQLEQTFRRLEPQVPPPVLQDEGAGFVLRYQEKTVQQALLQKFARQISGLYALDLLLQYGFCQEQGVIQRTLMDIDEDIMFLAIGMKTDWTKRHDEYLEYFWMEEQGAGMVPRDKIRAFVHNAGDDPSTGTAVSRRLFKAYSGYIHANSVAIVDMCAGEPIRYHLRGMIGSPLYADHVGDAWSYFYHGLASAQVMASAFEDAELWLERRDARRAFEAAHADRLFPPGEHPPWATAGEAEEVAVAGQGGEAATADDD